MTEPMTEQPIQVEASAAAEHVKDDKPDFDQLPPSEDDSTTYTTPTDTNRMLYRFLPIGSVTLTFSTTSPTSNSNSNDTSAATTSIHVSGSTCGCCCSIDQQIVAVRELQVKRQSWCNCLRLVRDAAMAFILAFLFHLLPAVIWGPERSLGSSANHIAMGYIWFGGWPIWFVIMQVFLRPWGIEITSTCGGKTKGDTPPTIFVPFASWRHATDVVNWWQNENNNKNNNNSQQQQQQQQQQPVPQRPPLLMDPWFVCGWLFSLLLIINMFVTGVLVTQCNDRGCCKDDEDTLDCCVETGYPEC